jgi:hypothetical protein
MSVSRQGMTVVTPKMPLATPPCAVVTGSHLDTSGTTSARASADKHPTTTPQHVAGTIPPICIQNGGRENSPIDRPTMQEG